MNAEKLTSAEPNFFAKGEVIGGELRRFPNNRAPAVYDAQAHHLKAVPTPNGFQWWIEALCWSEWVNGAPGTAPTMIGKPARTRVGGPFKSREIAYNDVVRRNNESVEARR